MNTIQRRFAAGALALGALVTTGTAAQAAEKVEDSRVSFEFVMPGMDNPCTPQFDDITLTANGHASSKVWLNDDGSRGRNLFHIHWDGQAADGTGYVGGDSFNAQTVIEDGWVYITADTKNHLISQGSDPNFDLRFKVRASFDLAGTSSNLEVIEDHAECRG